MTKRHPILTDLALVTALALDDELSKDALRLALAIGRRQGSNADTWPSIPVLVADIGLSKMKSGSAKQAVLRGLRQLEERGHLVVERAAGRGSRYRLLPRSTGYTRVTASDEDSSASTGDAHVTSEDTSTGDTGVTSSDPSTGDTHVTGSTGDTHVTGDAHVTGVVTPVKSTGDKAGLSHLSLKKDQEERQGREGQPTPDRTGSRSLSGDGEAIRKLTVEAYQKIRVAPPFETDALTHRIWTDIAGLCRAQRDLEGLGVSVDTIAKRTLERWVADPRKRAIRFLVEDFATYQRPNTARRDPHAIAEHETFDRASAFAKLTGGRT